MNCPVQQPSIPPTVTRVVGLDVHPDSFTASIIQGPTPVAAVVLHTFNKVPIAQLTSWAAKHTLSSDTLVLEASGNTFDVVRKLRSAERNALVLESVFIGKLKESHANNDRISATRIARAYLCGNAKTVWVPDDLTQQRRDLFHAHRKAVKGVTAANNSLSSYLSDNGVRLEKSLLEFVRDQRRDAIFKTRTWNPIQTQILEIHLLELDHHIELAGRLTSLVAQQVIQDPKLLELTRLCGIREVIAFAIGAIVGDINRFKSPKSLVKYAGLNPAFDDSGKGNWSGGIKGHGRNDLRSLLIEAGHALLRSPNHPNSDWGRKLLGRKSEVSLVVAALARKLITQVWYSLMGRTKPMEEVSKPMSQKIGKIISRIGTEGLKKLGITRKDAREQALEILRTRKPGREYVIRDQPPVANSGTPAQPPGRDTGPTLPAAALVAT
jgi:transposase